MPIINSLTRFTFFLLSFANLSNEGNNKNPTEGHVATGKDHSILDITKKHNSVKTVTVDVVVFLNFCTMSDDALIRPKFVTIFQSFRAIEET